MFGWLTSLFRRSGSTQRAGSPAIPASADPELRDIFINELDDIVKAVQTAFAAWREDWANPAHCRAVVRGFHTLKGAAPVVGATLLAELGLAAEQTTKRAGRKRNPDMNQIAAIETAVALLPQWAHAARNNLPIPETTRSVIATLKRAAS